MKCAVVKRRQERPKKMGSLTIDIGNTRSKAGFFEGEELVAVDFFEQDDTESLLGWATNHPVENIILSSVGGVSGFQQTLRILRERYGRVLELDATLPLPIVNEYETPETLGKDRLAAVVGATVFFPRQACLVIDAGTCITIDLIDAKGHYRGGNISPGLQMRLRAMHEFTARLPRPALKWPADWIGRTTDTALQNGALRGALLELAGYERLSHDEFGDINVLLTGGDSHILAKNWKSQIFVNQNLVLHGLNKMLTYNVERSE